MKSKLSLRLVLALICCTGYSSLVAQTDSSWLDLGRIKLKKEFTQTVTIKGKDLEQMPFANLSQAIDVWMYGLATNKGNLVYVIDGNLMTDVNVYSIHDIEEITLVQNALIQLNGATKEKQLILITTRKNNGKSAGINVAGSSFAVTNSFQDRYRGKQKGETNFYHQYYVSAYKNHDKIQYGLSASYLRDVYPYPKDGYDMKRPYHVNRFRFNGYLNASIDANNSVWLRAGYVPEKVGIEYSSNSIILLSGKTKTNYFTVEAGWQSRIVNKLTNEFSAGFTPVTTRANSTTTTTYPGTTGFIIREVNSGAKTDVSNFLINDNLTYHAGFGDWHIEPAVNFTYRFIKAKYTTSSTLTENPSGILAASETRNENKYNVFLLTPAVNVYYKNIFNVQGGFAFNISKPQLYSPKAEKILPFVTMTIDALKAFDPNSRISWKVYGSYAAAGNFADGAYQLNDATSFIQYQTPYNYTSEGYMPLLYGGDSSGYMVQAGTSIHLWNGRLQAGYSFERRKYDEKFATTVPGSPIPVIWAYDIYNTTHRLGITAKLAQRTRINWLTGLNISAIKVKLEGPYNTGGPVPTAFTRSSPLWTGGWVNRFNYQKWMVGLDVLYAFNQREYAGYIYGEDNAFSFRNIYAGYQLKVKHTPLDVYVECRNPGQKNESNLPDRREYYGLGFKAVL